LIGRSSISIVGAGSNWRCSEAEQASGALVATGWLNFTLAIPVKVLSPTALRGGRRRGAGQKGVADPPLERPDRFFAGVSFGDLAVVVGASFAVAVADLGDRGQMGCLRRRFPRRSRWLLRGPEDTLIGAVPL
jgi:hypothetical protein